MTIKTLKEYKMKKILHSFFLITFLAPASSIDKGFVAADVNAPQPLAANDSMKCMSSCLKYEGNSSTAKSTCKLRCSNISVPETGNSQGKDCMTLFKNCRNKC